jgi:adenine-specific DNA-methyltransferase
MDLKGIFDHPKPLALIKKTISIGMEKEDIVIDFFSGSGTTAQSVMELNRDDGGNRKFICVQLAESLDPENKDQKAGADFCDSIGKPRNIAEICKERIRRAIKNLEKKSEGNLPDIGRSEPEDLGFKAFKLGESRIRDWECGSAEELPKQIEASVNNIKTGTTDETLLFELMLSGEAVLTAEVEKKVIGKDSWYSVDEGSLAICVSRKMSQSLLDSVLKAKPRKAIFLDESFNGNDKIKKNATLQFRDAGIEVKFV